MINEYNCYQRFALYTRCKGLFCGANSLTSIVTRHPCMQDTPYLTLPFSLLSEIFSVFGFAKYAPIMFGKNVRTNKTCDHEVLSLRCRLKFLIFQCEAQNSRARCARTSCFGIAAELPAGSTFDKKCFETF